MYTIRPDKPVNPVLLDILSGIQAVTGALGCEYLLVGATARDMLMTHVFGLESRRATHDVDFAIALDDWARFDALKAALVATGSFAPAADRVHLLHYKPAEYGHAFPLDLIPFGGVEQEAHRIVWPPDMNVVMSVVGYAEALASALDVDAGHGLIVCLHGMNGACKTTRMPRTFFSFSSIITKQAMKFGCTRTRSTCCKTPHLIRPWPVPPCSAGTPASSCTTTRCTSCSPSWPIHASATGSSSTQRATPVRNQIRQPGCWTNSNSGFGRRCRSRSAPHQ
jgi:hypothetical protein